jgi:hypothetical protein
MKIEREDFNKKYWGIFGRENTGKKQYSSIETNMTRSSPNSKQEHSPHKFLGTASRQHAIRSAVSQKSIQILVSILFIRFLIIASFGL